MIRLSGILIGSMLAVAILILLIGVPRFPAKETAMATSSPPSAAVERQTAFEPTAKSTDMANNALEAEPAVALESASALQSEPQNKPQGEPQTNAQNETRSAAAAAAPPEQQPAGAETGQVNPETLLMQPEQHWYAFWSPFRSEIAANGFVSQLQRVTGFDYRVVKQKAGVYEVALAYSNDAEIPQMLEQISAATGLDIPES